MSKRSRATKHRPAANEDDLLPEYDFSGGERGKYAHLFYEGAPVVINGKNFVVKGRSFVPAPAVGEDDEKPRKPKRYPRSR